MGETGSGSSGKLIPLRVEPEETAFARRILADSTVRLFDAQPSETRFTARVVAVDGGRVALDRTLFYPTGGGQPCDRGTLGGASAFLAKRDA